LLACSIASRRQSRFTERQGKVRVVSYTEYMPVVVARPLPNPRPRHWGGGQPSSAPPGPWLGAAPPPGPGLGAASAAGPGSQKPSPDAGGRRPGRPEIVDIGGGSARLSFCAWGRASGIAASQDGTVGEGCVGWGQTRTRGGAERGRAVGGVVHGL
jgi:hypothetical protein